MKGYSPKLEAAPTEIGDDVYKAKQEFERMAAENRQQQTHNCALQDISSGGAQE